MKQHEKLAYLHEHHFQEFSRVRDAEETKESKMFCVCGRLATGLHERSCKKFQAKVTANTIKRLEYLIPKCAR